MPIGISSPRRRLYEPEADGQKTKNSVDSVSQAKRVVNNKLNDLLCVYPTDQVQ